MDEGSEVTEEMVFRGVEFSVKIEVDHRLLIVEISDLVTADQWRGDFDPACKYRPIPQCLKLHYRCTEPMTQPVCVCVCVPGQILRI